MNFFFWIVVAILSMHIGTHREEGYLRVSDIHELYYVTYGNPDGIPVIVLHGGPGGGCPNNLIRFFDLDKWNVILFDQRGAARSKPHGCMEENTTQLLIQDIETLRKHLGIDRWVVFGGSWGSLLGILYGEEHAQSCLGFILRGIFLGRERDTLHIYHELAKKYPNEYRAFLNHYDIKEHSDLHRALYHKIMHTDPHVHMPIARDLAKLFSAHYPTAPTEQQIGASLGSMRTFAHYTYHNFFLKPNQALEQLPRIAYLPAIIIHGRQDVICSTQQAFDLHRHWSYNSHLWIIEGAGHSANDPAIEDALKKAVKHFEENL